VNYRGLAVTCDDADEVDQLAERVGRRLVSPSSIVEVVSKLGGSGSRMVKLLAEQHAPIPQSLVATLMNLTEVQLPGILTAISKPLKAAGFELSDLVNITAPNVSGGERMYSLVPAVIEDVRRVLGLK
jgi:hypothetical protein